MVISQMRVFFSKNRFIHKKLDFTFSFDENFYFLNNPNFLLGLTDKETKVVFDIDKTSKKNDLEYLSAWMKVRKKKYSIINFRITTILKSQVV